jgi:hypothetical protein
MAGRGQLWRSSASAPGRLARPRPGWKYFHAPPATFDRLFTAQLEQYGAREIARRMAQIARSGFAEPAGRLVLLCWEVNQADCHRGLRPLVA